MYTYMYMYMCMYILTIILGRVAYLGSFNLRSADITVGIDTLMCSKPPSISLITFKWSPSFSILEANVALIKNRIKTNGESVVSNRGIVRLLV